MNSLVTQHLPLLADSPKGVQKLRELILELAVRGKLVPQDPNDEPASIWLERITLEKTQLHQGRKLRELKTTPESDLEQPVNQLPKSWQWVVLADITLGMDSGWSPACEPNPSPSDSIWGVLKTTAVQVMQYLECENKELPLHLEPRLDAEVKIGDILFTRAGPTNRVGISCLVEATRPRLMISDKIIRFHPVEIGTYGRYIALCLNTGNTAMYLESAKSGMAASQVNISQEKLKRAPIPLPPLPEQHRIVAKVDELMALCDRLEARQADAESAHAQLVKTLLDSLTQAQDSSDFAAHWQRLSEHFHSLFTTESSIDALKQSLLQLAVMGKLVPQDPNDEPASELLKRIAEEKARLVAEGKIRKQKPLAEIKDEEKPFELPEGWEWVRLDVLLKKIGAGSTPLGGKQAYVAKGIKFLRSQNVWNDGLRLREVVFIPEATHQKMCGTHVEAGDLLFNITGASIGRCSVVPADFDTGNVSQHVTIIRTVEKDIRAFLHLVLTSQHVQQTVMDVQVGVSREGLSIGKLSQFLIPLPPLTEQHCIVAKVDQLMALCDQLKAQLSQARQLQTHLANALVEQAVA